MEFYFFGHLRVSFYYFPNTALNYEGFPPLIPFRIFVDHVAIFSSSHMQHLRWCTLWQKMVIAGNCCWLLLQSFVFLNVVELLHPTLKCIDKFSWGNKVFHPPFTCSKLAKKNNKTNKAKKQSTRTMWQIHSKLTVKTPEWCLVLYC